MAQAENHYDNVIENIIEIINCPWRRQIGVADDESDLEERQGEEQFQQEVVGVQRRRVKGQRQLLRVLHSGKFRELVFSDFKHSF